MKYLFVYGSLMKGEKASCILENCKYCGKYILRDYAMYNLGEYPGIVPQKGENVLGEVYRISESIIPQLDRYEVEGSLYIRKTVAVSKSDKQIYAMSYIYNHDIIKNNELLREGWNPKKSDYVWYAGYGSNLSNERFLYYIKGGYYPETRREYSGCNDKKIWIFEQFKKYPGKMYFAKQSSAWDNKGVAFYNPEGTGFTYMKLFKITREQFHEIQKQEGMSWYGRIVCLDVLEDDCPVYTITNEKKLEENAPSKKYLELIKESLSVVMGEKRQFEIQNYLDECLTKKL